MGRFDGLDLLTRVIIVVLIVVVSYLALFLALSSLFVPSSSATDMMGHMMSFNQNTVAVNLGALALALVIGIVVSVFLMTGKTVHSAASNALSQRDELEIIKRALSDDEKMVLDEVRRAGEITQDSLRFRLDWSKAKLSRILTNLDKMNLIQRERVGKTYNVFLAGQRRNSEETV